MNRKMTVGARIFVLMTVCCCYRQSFAAATGTDTLRVRFTDTRTGAAVSPMLLSLERATSETVMQPVRITDEAKHPGTEWRYDWVFDITLR